MYIENHSSYQYIKFNLTPEFISVFSLSIFVTLIPDSRKPACFILIIFTYLINLPVCYQLPVSAMTPSCSQIILFGI